MSDFTRQAEPAVYVLHENEDWLPPLREAFAAPGVPLREIELTAGSIDLAAEPPQGVFWSRLSASSHTRDHGHAKEYARAVLRWLEAHGRRVVNGSHVIEFEVSKVAQTAALAAAGFDVPHTVAVFGKDELVARAAELATPFITKHNQGGKGLGVRRFDSLEEFVAYVDGPDFEEPIDGITLLQEYLVGAEAFITRAEFVDGEFVYAVRVDTSAGSFELCPAEACAVPVGAGGVEAEGLAAAPIQLGDFAPAAAACEVGADSLFSIRESVTVDDELIVRLRDFLAANRIEIAGIEFMETVDGRRVVYDINTNTNYNPDVEAIAPASAAASLVRALGRELDQLRK
ncbi:ATP-grasp domain-containing protein [Gulosibacter sp. ACHW.36C]|uniref:Alpha-L-glutamate ligase n=1 Tax=Gulosibacter sediminis TaxID=1729695 RepID=A0ABY4MXZ3_9MICO|nr:alpha-L-glutamate ligase [Gulosibacter sediminis]UQN15302.1 alpha-L-glutamate ligase [Gulosibacter sediminis]